MSFFSKKSYFHDSFPLTCFMFEGMPNVKKSTYFYRGRSQNWKTSKLRILTPCARVRAGISTSDIHFIISKTISAVRADATEVPMSKHKSSIAQTVYPLQGGKVHPNFENKKKFRKKNLASTTTRKIRWIHWWNPFLNPLTIKGDLQFCDRRVCSFQYVATQRLQLGA